MSGHFKLAIFILILSLLTPILLRSMQTRNQTAETKAAQVNLQHATMAAVESAFYKSDNETLNLYSTPEARESAVETFFEVFTKSMGMSTVTDTYFMARYLVPVIVMVDNDGYYIMYAKTNNADSGDGKVYTDIITPLNTWEELVEEFSIRYYLISSYVEVTDTSANKIFKGTPNDVYDKMKKTYGESYISSKLAFLGDANSFKSKKNDVVLSTLQESINYMINTHNTFFNTYDVNYSFVMPQIKGDFQDVLEGPTFLAFEQGRQTLDTGDSIANIYALASSDIVGLKPCYIIKKDGELLYHYANCPDITEEEKENAICGTAKYCASHGAQPCRDCIR